MNAIDALRRHAPAGLRLSLTSISPSMVQLWLLNEELAADRPPRHLATSVADAPPFWSLCWASGSVLAGMIATSPELVRGKTVVDFGAGSGIVAIAAKRAGAKHCLAVDIDPGARLACRANAEANGVEIEIAEAMPLPQSDVLFAAELFYDAQNIPLIERLRAAGSKVIVADARRPDLAKYGLRFLRSERAPTIPDFQDPQFETVRIFESMT